MKEEFKPQLNYLLINATEKDGYITALYISEDSSHQVTRKFTKQEWEKYHG